MRTGGGRQNLHAVMYGGTQTAATERYFAL